VNIFQRLFLMPGLLTAIQIYLRVSIKNLDLTLMVSMVNLSNTIKNSTKKLLYFIIRPNMAANKKDSELETCPKPKGKSFESK